MDYGNSNTVVDYVKNGEYSLRPPSPPHIHIPNAPENLDITLKTYGRSETGEYYEIMEKITRGDHTVHAKDWKYEWRRGFQAVLTFLYLGPSSAARNAEAVRKAGITMLLAIRDTTTANAGLLTGQKVADQLGIKVQYIDVAGAQELIAKLPTAIDCINNHLVEMYIQRGGEANTPDDAERHSPTWGKVLVFCETGNDRSAAVVAAYLMATYEESMVKTLQYMSAVRFCVVFDDTYKNMLYSWQQILEAKQSVRMVNVPKGYEDTSKMKSKRRNDEMDEDMEDADDEARFRGRTAFAPFTPST